VFIYKYRELGEKKNQAAREGSMTSWQAIGVRQDMVFIFVFTLALQHITFNATAAARSLSLSRPRSR